jgi:hypothetical protein
MPPPPGSRVPPRYDDRGDWWGPRDRFGGPPGPGYGMPPPLMGPQTATAPPSNRPPPQPQTATPTGYWGGPPGPSDEWNDHHYYDRRFPPNNGPLPPPPTYATQRGP